MARNSSPGDLSDSLLPPGLTFSPGSDVRSAPEPEPSLDDKLLPPGLTFKPSAAPAPGMTTPAKPEPAKPLPGPEIPDDDAGPQGWMQVAKSAFGRRMAERAADDATGGQLLLPQGVGGLTFDQQYQKKLATPEHKDYTDNLLGQGIGEGWTNPHWWVAQLAGNLGGVTPGLAAAGAASLTPLGPLGGIGAFGLEAAVGNLPSAYNAARARGLDDQAAIRQAIIESGLSSAFAVGMGMAGKFNVTGA